LISSGVISDGKNNATDRIAKKIKELKDNTIKIQLYQVSTTHLNNPSKYLYKSFKYLSDETNTKAVVLNPEVDIAFLRNETREKLSITIESPMISVINDEYLDEFSNNGEKSTFISKMQYTELKNPPDYASFSEIHFYLIAIKPALLFLWILGKEYFMIIKKLWRIFSKTKTLLS